MAKSRKKKSPPRKKPPQKLQGDIDSVIWKAYTHKNLFEILVADKDDKARLKADLENNGFDDVPEATLTWLQDTLNRAHLNIHLSPIEFMRLLRTHTSGKRARSGSWVQW